MISCLFLSLSYEMGLKNVGDTILWNVMLCSHLKFMASHFTRMY